MLPSGQTLTTTKSHANHHQEDLTYSAKSLISSSFVFLHVEKNKTKAKEDMQARPQSRANDEELWFSMGSNRHEEGQTQAPPGRQEQSAYHSTVSGHSTNRSLSSNHYPQIPVISTSVADRTLSESPESQKRKHKPAGLRNLLSRRPSHEVVNSGHLQPNSARPYQPSSRDGKLSPEPFFPPRTSSRSMPSSPLDASSNSNLMSRARSTEPGPIGTTTFQAYSLFPAPLQTKQRSVSTEAVFGPGAPRASRTFPETNRPTATLAINAETGRPPVHTWRSPTEPFNNDDEFHLFAEATSGLPGGLDSMSTNEAPTLQASLFARGRQNDTIPLPFQDYSAFEQWQPRPSEFIPRQQPREPSPARPEYSYRAEPSYTPREIVPTPSMDEEWNPQQRQRDFATSSSALPGMDSYDPPSSYDLAPSSYNLPPSYDLPPSGYNAEPSSSALPRRASYDRPPTSPMPANLIAVNMELERLGIDEAPHDDDELPNYAQSQAEAHEKKRVEAAARARELENRWNVSRGRGER
jgi:hypothetical protein